MAQWSRFPLLRVHAWLYNSADMIVWVCVCVRDCVDMWRGGVGMGVGGGGVYILIFSDDYACVL